MAIEILLATSNPGKIKRYRALFQKISPAIILRTPIDVGLEQLVIEETGKTEEENALLKAKGYWDQLQHKIPCFAGDTGAYLNGVLPEEQPGVATRRITNAGSHHSKDGDQIMRQFYQDLCSKYGGQLTAYYLDSHCLYTGEAFIDQNKRIFTLTNDKTVPAIPGLPMVWKGSIVHKYQSEMTEAEYLLEMTPIITSIKSLLQSAKILV
ncbi:hypothetical protein KBB08_02530 [Candidatus Gracilibacteria bacterium]|nr:hypothetical protein [Candidatus Gracilibacteria bacterium]